MYDSGTNTITYEGPLPVSGQQEVTAWFEGFESGVPPTGWSVSQTNPNQTWATDGNDPFEGDVAASVTYDDQLLDQNELLFSPQIVLDDLGANTLTFQSMGSLAWCREDFDNCDLEVWVMVGEALGDSDDIVLGLADDFWSDNYVWSPVTFDLVDAGVPRDQPVAFVFRYVGNDGAQVLIDAVELLAIGPAPVASITISARVNGEVAAGGHITNTATLGAEHTLAWGKQSETPVTASATSHVGQAAVNTSFMEAPSMEPLGDNIVYHIHVINSGDALAEGVMVTGTIPVSTTFVGLNSGPPNQAFTYNAAASRVEWMGNLAPGEHRVLTYAVMPDETLKVGDRIMVSGGITHSGVTMTMEGMTMIMGSENVYFPSLFNNPSSTVPPTE
jgi:uncharacterized repeat protein (TIGR01451 family)